jgi:superkiller protein 3
LNKYDEAIAAYNKAIEINPQYSYAWADKGKALVKLGKSEKAITAYDKALEINPRNLIALEGKETLSK